MKSFPINLIPAAVLVAGIALMSPNLKATDPPDAEPVSSLLAQAMTTSGQISADWKSFMQQPKLSWASDSAESNRMKEDARGAGMTLAKLTSSRSQASPSQLIAIDQIIEVMQEIAVNATNSVDFLNSSHARLSDKEYKAYLTASSDSSTRLAGLVTQLVTYESHRDKFENAKRMLLSAK